MDGTRWTYKLNKKESLFYPMEQFKQLNPTQESNIQSTTQSQISELILIFWILNKTYIIQKLTLIMI